MSSLSIRHTFPVLLIWLIFSSVVFAAGDPVKGKEFAQDLCARCHNIDPGGPFKQHPPSFAAIAMYRSRDQIYGRIVFPPLHAAMPQIGYMLTPKNVDHVVAFIVSLENADAH